MDDQELQHHRSLLMGLLDDELSPDELIEVNDALRRSAELRHEYETLIQTEKQLNAVSFIEPSDVIAQKMWRSPYHRLTRKAGLWLLIGGNVLLLLYGAILYLTSESPMIPRFATAAICLGTTFLLISIISERIKNHKTDPYKDIEK